MAHAEIPIKVTAWVDEGIAPLVAALNRFHNVLTMSSCEGDGGEDAHVTFAVRGDHRELEEFIHNLSVRLGQAQRFDAPFRLQMEWVAGASQPIATLVTPLDFVKPLACAIESVADSVNAGRTNPSQHGTHGRALRSSATCQNHQGARHECGGTPRSTE